MSKSGVCAFFFVFFLLIGWIAPAIICMFGTIWFWGK